MERKRSQLLFLIPYRIGNGKCISRKIGCKKTVGRLVSGKKRCEENRTDVDILIYMRNGGIEFSGGFPSSLMCDKFFRQRMSNVSDQIK
jgi:hypothetical protein